MSETKFTPGPWVISNSGSAYMEGTIILTEDQCYELAGVWRDSDVSLIAAAPDLYEALEQLHAEQNGPPLEKYKTRWEEAMRKTEDALAKARGEE